MIIGGSALLLTLFTVAAALMGLALVVSGDRILPGVSVGGVPVGNQSVDSAAQTLAEGFQNITVRDGKRTWRVPAEMLGLTFDAAASAQAGARYGRGEGNVLVGVLGQANVAPILSVDLTKAAEGLTALAETVDSPAKNATVRVENGGLLPVEAQAGRVLNIGETVVRFVTSNKELSDGALDLVMDTVQPAITDPSVVMAKVQALLASPLTINGYNPVSDKVTSLQIPPQTWIAWLTPQNTSDGVALSLDDNGLSSWFSANANAFGDSQYIKPEEAVKAAQQALIAQQTTSQIRLYNRPTQYVVQSGDTLGSIAWRVGVQMFLIQQANPGVNLEALGVGQSITIPSKDDLLPLPIIPNKRIVISISQQRTRVYENGALKWDWSASTGIASSPTQPGVYQVRSHDGTAYASNWNLYMPSFLSIYEAVPGFYNGIHGFPSRGGSQIIWENALGRRVTYGCILISSANARLLYEWAEDGVVVEIQP